MKLTATNLVSEIDRLPKSTHYDYVNSRTTTKIVIVNVTKPEGPITISRYNPSKGEGPGDSLNVNISTEMIWRIANSINKETPINFDRILGGSYNTRSAFEALLAHTPQFYYCYPGRIQSIHSSTEIKPGHKHLMWKPDEPHQTGVMQEIQTSVCISEIPTTEIVYDSLTISSPTNEINIIQQRRHAQIQIALYTIGRQLDSKVWIASNDRSINYKGQRIAEFDGVIPNLSDVRLLQSFSEAAQAARLIDVIWFRNGKFMPAVFEIEHSTGVTSGLTRMKNFQDNFLPQFKTRYVIVAPDEIREKVYRETNKEQFKDLNSYYFPYSAVEELYSLCQRRKIKGVNDDFLDSFMEPCIEVA